MLSLQLNMITVVFTPFGKSSKGYQELHKFIKRYSAYGPSDIKLPSGMYETNLLHDQNSKSSRQVARELNYNPPRAVIIDARNPDLISNALTTLSKLVGTKSFRACNLAGRFFLITQDSSDEYIVNGLLSKQDEYLQNLIQKVSIGPTSLL